MATPAAKPSQLTTTQTSAIRGPVLTYSGDSFQRGLGETMHYEADAIVCMAAGRITHFSPAQKMRIREIVS
jgi:guanine deaminase